MIIRNLLNDVTAAEAGSLTIGGIGAGIYRPIRLEQVGAVTSISLIFSRNGATKATAVVTPYEGAVLDISMMAAATPSITESINAGLGFTDFVDNIQILYMEGTQKSITIRVIHAALADGAFATAGSTRNLSDYGNGLFNQVDFSCASFLNSPLTGAPFNFALRYGQYTANSDGRLRYRNNGTGTSSIWGMGDTLSTSANQPMREFRTANDASVWGNARFERKYPYCPDPNKRVTLRWLNSKGAYDTMYFDQYRIVPTYLVNFSGGNRVLSYDVTINVVVTDDNQNALYWLSRSGEVAGVFPLATNQWARVTIQNPNALNIQGGATGRVAAFKCKFEIIEP
ncbi:hypothetical protein BU183P1_00006 [Bacteroides phage BU183P1]|nr:hypothetical protein BU183P1_00006 [Bacteroides phage BU183P1]WAX10105.1 hypothetical protein BU183P2_00044 [Bacteroides phage BU183P2]